MKELIVAGAKLAQGAARLMFGGVDIPIVGEPEFRTRAPTPPFVPLGPVSYKGRIVSASAFKRAVWLFKRDQARRAKQKAQRLARRTMRHAR